MIETKSMELKVSAGNAAKLSVHTLFSRKRVTG
jgi:hypothetical protein